MPRRAPTALLALFTLFTLSAAALSLAAFTSAEPPRAAQPSPEALELRNLGLAQLENEQPAEAEATFRKLAEKLPGDPLPDANLAVAALRQQKAEEAQRRIEAALQKAPGRADLLALQGDVLRWIGRPEEALAAYRAAASAAPEEPRVQYSLFREATAAEPTELSRAAASEALAALTRLRPENLAVLLQAGRDAVARGDRAEATRAFLRVGELLGAAPGPAASTLAGVLSALESGEIEAARVPAARLENVLRVTPLYQQSLAELSPGIQGHPVERFAAEPPPSSFGEPVPVRFEGRRLAPGAATAAAASGLAAVDLDGDGRPELARIVPGAPAGEGGSPARVQVLRFVEGEWREAASVPAPPAQGSARLLAFDLDNDGRLDLLAAGPGRATLLRNGQEGFVDATAAHGLATAGGAAAAAFDFDQEGDLDLAVAGPEGGRLLRNPGGGGALEAVDALPAGALKGARALVAGDLDRDGDPDLAAATPRGLVLLDNLRQGRFADRTAEAGLPGAPAAEALLSADLDNDGRPDLVAAGTGVEAWRNVSSDLGGRFVRWPLAGLPEKGSYTALAAFDADNDGRLDLVAAGPSGVAVLAQRGPAGEPSFEALPVAGAPAVAAGLAVADLDGDGDLDLAVSGPEGLFLLENRGGNENHWLEVRLQGLAQGSGKNNHFGIGATLEVRAGGAYQFREVAGPVTHFGLGALRRADSVRVVWTNGVPQNRIRPESGQRIVEEQVLKGSCPFLYAWDGEGFAFVTDLLWGSPIGLPVAPGVWAGADPDELVRVDGLVPFGADDDSRYLLRVTEELWEAAFFDHLRLWVVDHPEGVEVASALRIVPGEAIPEDGPERVLASRGLRPVAAAWDGAGAEATSRVRERDEVYASGYAPGPYQGVAARPWAFTFDLGEAPNAPVRLHLDGWIFPADASLNLAVAQRRDLPPLPPGLEVETAEGWRVLMPAMGHPAGKTKTMVVDTPPLPPGARRLRVVTSLWLAWDRIAWTAEPADEAPVVRARLLPAEAELRPRGFSALVRRAPNAPHAYDYARVTAESPWLPFPGRYTRFGDVRELLAAPDDRSVILAPGDEIALAFDAGDLPPVPAGWRRTLFLESHGWDKDADRNTWEAGRMEPLPFRAMTGYPYAPGEGFPDTPELREYRQRWLTREVGEP